MKTLLKSMVFVYQGSLGLWLGGHCRFYPSCSNFFHQALDKYHWSKAVWLSTWRLLRCHPFSPGGIDRP